MGESYVYVFVRQDLPIEHQMVQACHACLEAGASFYRPGVGHQPVEYLEPRKDVASLILIGVKDVQELHKVAAYLRGLDIRHEMFYEPDPGADGVDKGWTAIATEPLRGKIREGLKRFQLWKL